VTLPNQVTDFISAAAKTLGGIDILVNNAGAAHPGTFETLTDEDWHGDLDVKLFPQIRCTRAALAHLRQSSAPRVIKGNAVYAKYPDPKFFATTVNRAACLNLNKALALQHGAEGILVNSVNIGFVVTPQWQNIRSKRATRALSRRVLRRARSRGGAAGPVRRRVGSLRADRLPREQPSQLHHRDVDRRRRRDGQVYERTE